MNIPWTELFFGFASICFAFCIAVLLSGDSEKRKRIFESFSSLVIAFSTIALVVVTYWHIDEARNMRKTTEKMAIETKRLADISVEQFRIKSYPTIMIPKKEYYLESNKIIQKFSFTNKGELSAFNLSVLVINTFKGKIRRKPNDLIFRENLGAFYSIDKDSLASDKITSIDFETKLPKDLSYNLTSREPIKTPIPFRANHPIHALVIIRFKVPYGNYCYETYSFVLKEEKTWQRMSDSDTYDLLKKYFRKVKNEKALKFLSHNEQLFRYQTKDIWKR